MLGVGPKELEADRAGPWSTSRCRWVVVEVGSRRLEARWRLSMEDLRSPSRSDRRRPTVGGSGHKSMEMDDPVTGSGTTHVYLADDGQIQPELLRGDRIR
jgi:hypothetical protein